MLVLDKLDGPETSRIGWDECSIVSGGGVLNRAEGGEGRVVVLDRVSSLVNDRMRRWEEGIYGGESGVVGGDSIRKFFPVQFYVTVKVGV